MYDFERKKVKRFLELHEAHRPAVQAPSGLREFVDEIILPFKEVDVGPVILADSCYGACDLVDVRAKRLGCDVLIHYGHADMGLSVSLPTLYVEARMKVDPLPAIENTLPALEDSRLGLVTTVQHIGWIDRVKDFLEESGFEVVIGDPGHRVKYPGQVLGCDWSCAKSVVEDVDGFLYLGTGRFHSLGVALATNRKVVMVDPIAKGHEILSPEVDNFLNRRRRMLSRGAVGESFGVLACIKPGQQRLGLAERLAGRLRSHGYEAQVLLVDDLDPEKLNDFEFDVFVSTACPRIAMDDAELYDRPILTPFETRVLVGETDFTPYQLDEMSQDLNDDVQKS